MTSAPDTLMAARRLLLTHLDVQPGRTVASDLDPAEVGIVGDPDHVGGYHCGTDRVRREGGQIRDYSVTESTRDRTGLSDYACALDIGEFRRTVAGRVYDLPHLSAWIVAQCTAGTADTRDIREVIWSPDGRTVRRWDRLGRRSTGDSSHRWHTHISYHRDAIKAGRDQTALFRRYLTTIGLIKGDTMATVSEIVEGVWSAGFGKDPNRRTAGQLLAESRSSAVNSEILLGQVQGQIAHLAAQVALWAGQDPVDEQAIIDGVLAGLGAQPLHVAAETLRAVYGPERAAELGALLTAGQSQAG
ncbi:hypothetical protein [Micromonospora sp. NBRC 101691]|uniref:hypothetical protein n=1 Tax=Micromonospora sp. NBRC 101691 TaxID=3032198 RepID=UPI0024A12C4F|nr:hypothetical protein [Micromonospora sp. NBRC 101691]GLY21707.1 hypothetical protein Misp04_14390 [Micromonospora sp. NBRC 101691]